MSDETLNDPTRRKTASKAEARKAALERAVDLTMAEKCPMKPVKVPLHKEDF